MATTRLYPKLQSADFNVYASVQEMGDTSFTGSSCAHCHFVSSSPGTPPQLVCVRKPMQPWTMDAAAVTGRGAKGQEEQGQWQGKQRQ